MPTSRAFRSDLLSCIDVWTIDLPALAERPNDVAEFAEALLARIADQEQTVTLPLSSSAAAALAAAPWPDNVRGLRKALYRGLLRAVAAGHARIEVEDLVLGTPQVSHGAYHEALRAWQRAWLADRLVEHGWRVDETAGAIELSRARLYALIRELGLERPRAS